MVRTGPVAPQARGPAGSPAGTGRAASPALARDTRGSRPRPRGGAIGPADPTPRGALPSPARPQDQPGRGRPRSAGAGRGHWRRPPPHPALAPAGVARPTHSPGRRHERGRVSALPPPPFPPRCATRGGASRRPPAARRALRAAGAGPEEGFGVGRSRRRGLKRKRRRGQGGVEVCGGRGQRRCLGPGRERRRGGEGRERAEPEVASSSWGRRGHGPRTARLPRCRGPGLAGRSLQCGTRREPPCPWATRQLQDRVRSTPPAICFMSVRTAFPSAEQFKELRKAVTAASFYALPCLAQLLPLVKSV